MVLQVTGKGNRRPVVAIPEQAFEAFSAIWPSVVLAASRQLLLTRPSSPWWLTRCSHSAIPRSTPMCEPDSKSDCAGGVTCEGAHETQSDLDPLVASHVWYSGCGRGLPIDVLQTQMGHSSSAITTELYGRELLGRRADEMQKAFRRFDH